MGLSGRWRSNHLGRWVRFVHPSIWGIGWSESWELWGSGLFSTHGLYRPLRIALTVHSRTWYRHSGYRRPRQLSGRLMWFYPMFMQPDIPVIAARWASRLFIVHESSSLPADAWRLVVEQMTRYSPTNHRQAIFQNWIKIGEKVACDIFNRGIESKLRYIIWYSRMGR